MSLHYQGNGVYKFYNEFGHTITLTKNDVDVICTLASLDNEFLLGRRMQELSENSKMWADLYAVLMSDYQKFVSDMINMSEAK